MKYLTEEEAPQAIATVRVEIEEQLRALGAA